MFSLRSSSHFRFENHTLHHLSYERIRYTQMTGNNLTFHYEIVVNLITSIRLFLAKWFQFTIASIVDFVRHNKMKCEILMRKSHISWCFKDQRKDYSVKYDKDIQTVWSYNGNILEIWCCLWRMASSNLNKHSCYRGDLLPIYFVWRQYLQLSA